MALPAGKVPPHLLARLFSALHLGSDVVVGPGIGRDAAVLRVGDRLLVAKCDPITFATDRIGWYAVNVNANDLAAMGAQPRWFLATVLFPEGTPDEAVDSVFTQLRDACAAVGVDLVGGHSEITVGLDRTIVAGAMLGDVEEHSVLGATGAQPGDTIILTKRLAVEGTALIARECAERLVDAGLFPESVERMKALLDAPGISVVRDAAIARRAGEVHAMHDPTEGGLASALHELAIASQIAIELDEESIPVLDETLLLCRTLSLDPLAMLASGSLLITVAPESAKAVLEALEAAGIPATVIGSCIAAPPAVTVRLADGGMLDLALPERDEVARYLERS